MADDNDTVLAISFRAGKLGDCMLQLVLRRDPKKHIAEVS